jgi:hypothetical protein
VVDDCAELLGAAVEERPHGAEDVANEVRDVLGQARDRREPVEVVKTAANPRPEVDVLGGRQEVVAVVEPVAGVGTSSGSKSLTGPASGRNAYETSEWKASRSSSGTA